MPRLLDKHVYILPLIFLLLATCAEARLTQGPTQTASAAEVVIRVELDKYLARTAAKDIEGLLALWSEKAAEREKIRQQFQSRFQQEEYGSITPEISRFKSAEGTASVRVGFKALRLDPAEGRKQEQFIFRNLAYALENGEWKVVRDTDAAIDLAQALINAETEAGCDRLLAEEKELLTTELADALKAQGARLAGRARFSEARKANLLMQKISERLGDAGRVGAALMGLGYVHWQLGDYAEAIGLLQKSLGMTEAAGQKQDAAAILNNIGNVYREQGQFGLAREYYEKSRLIYESLENKTGIAMELGNLGVVYVKQGNFAAAFDYYRKSLAISETSSDQLGVAITLGNIGALYRKQGDYAQALAYYQKSLAISQKIEDNVGIAQMLNNMGNIYLFQGEYSKALENYQENLAMSRTMNARGRIANAYSAIGRVYEKQGNYPLAEEYIRKGQEIFESNGDREGIARTLVNLGVVTKKQGRYAEALELARRAGELAREMDTPEILMASRVNAALALRALDKTQAAYQAFDEAIGIVETMRFQVAGLEQDQQRFFESMVSPYLAMADLLIAEKRATEALLFAERAKARVLLDVVQAGRIDLNKAMSAAEQEQERRLYAQLVSANLQLSRERKRADASSARLAEIEAGQQKARLAFEDFRKSLYVAHPELRVHRGDAEPLKAEQLAALLPTATDALLEFLVTEENTYLFVVAKVTGSVEAAVRCYAINIARDALAKEIETFRRQLAHRDLGFRVSSGRLYSLLLKPAESQLRGKSNLVIVPDGNLWELPFQALSIAPQRFLIEQAAITYAPSLTVYREIRNRRPRPVEKIHTTLLALGNPQLGSDSRNRTGNALRDEMLSSLPEAENEVRGLARFYPAAKIYVGSEASEDRIKAESARATILHFATHGTLNNASPMYSSLALARGTGNHEDGLLEAWELMNLDLKADLAVLSACETARGRFASGEGLIGLSWALFVAGVPSTVVSQWKVESSSTRDLMLRFHRYLQPRANGRGSIAEALQRASLSMMKQSGKNHPFYWAGFVLIGDAQ